MEFQFDAKRGTQDTILSLTDEFWGETEFKSGGINIESIQIGNEDLHTVYYFTGTLQIGGV